MRIIREEGIPPSEPALARALGWLEDSAPSPEGWIAAAPHVVYDFGDEAGPESLVQCGWRWIAYRAVSPESPASELGRPMGLIDLCEIDGEVTPVSVLGEAAAVELVAAIHDLTGRADTDAEVVLRSIPLPGQRAELLWLHQPGGGFNLLFPTFAVGDYPALKPLALETLPLLAQAAGLLVGGPSAPDAHGSSGG